MQNLPVSTKIILLLAAKIMRERGWCRGTFECVHTGRVCMMGAIKLAIADLGLTAEDAARWLAECEARVKRALNYGSVIAVWNDNHCPGGDAAIATLEAAATIVPTT